MARILIVDDDQLVRNSIGRCISGMGHDVLLAGSLAEGLAHAESGVDVVYLDLNLPDGNGQSVLEALHSGPEAPEIIVITGVGNNYGAEGALTRGVWEYIPKPASPAIIRESLASVLEYRMDRLATVLQGATGSGNGGERTWNACGIVGGSAAMQRMGDMMKRAAESDASVLVLGETGSGKELAAKAIHENSRRRNGPFVVVDCSNLTESLVESVLYGHVKGAFTGAHSDRTGLVAEADGGTLFLDEVGELPATLQKSFLRVLQERRYRPVGGSRELSSDFRLVAATNRSLDAMTRDGLFRSDLLFRLRTVEITLPALRERGDDVITLARHFVAESCRRYSLPPKKLARPLLKGLSGHNWPGNVRELRNVMEAAVIEAGQGVTIYPKHLPSQVRVAILETGVRSQPTPAEARQNKRDEITWNGLTYLEYKRIRDCSYFQQLMDVCEFDMLRASQLSGLSVASIYRHLAHAGISGKGNGRGGRK